MNGKRWWAAAAVGLGVVAAGCSSEHEPEEPPIAQSDPAPPDERGPASAGGDRRPPRRLRSSPRRRPRPAVPDKGPWPEDAVKNYSKAFGIGAVRGIAIDGGHNLWLLDGAKLGVLRPGDEKPTWTSGVGQAGRGYASTVICGGKAGHAYVGYWSSDSNGSTGKQDHALKRTEWSPGDADYVQLDPDGKVSLTEHINLFNTNDHKYNENVAVYSCVRVMRGPFAGEVYLGGNHGATRVRDQGCETVRDPVQQGFATCYNEHRHAVWDVNGSLRIGYIYALGISNAGDLLMGNEWKVSMLTPTKDPELAEWDDFAKTPWRLDTYVRELNSLSEFDFWRSVTQAKDGTYYWGSLRYGLWEMKLTARPNSEKYDPTFTRLDAPSGEILALAGTDDGSVFVGTGGRGLYRMTPDKQLVPVKEVSGSTVKQLLYDPTVSPSMLWVLTNAGVWVLRGY